MSATSLGKQRGCGGRGGESRLVNAIVPQAGWLHLREAGAEGGGKAGGNTPAPSDAFQVLPAPLCGVEGLKKKPIRSWLTGSYRPLGLDFCACAMCLGGEATDPGPPSDPFALSLKRSIILVQELPDGSRQLGHFLIGVQVAVDSLPTKVLEGGHIGGERSAQYQRNLLAPRIDVVSSLGGTPGECLGRWLLRNLRGGFRGWR